MTPSTHKLPLIPVTVGESPSPRMTAMPPSTRKLPQAFARSVAGVLACTLALAVLPAAPKVVAQDAAVADSPLFWSQDRRRIAFTRIAELLPTRVIEAGGHVYPLGERPRDMSDITYAVEGQDYRLADFLAMESLVGLIVVQDNDILLEHYAPGNTASSRWVSFSVTKSVSSLLIGAAIKDGYIGSVDDPVVRYVPRFRGTGYEDVSIRDVLHMASGVRWNEDYTDPTSDVARAGGANGLNLLNYLATLPHEAPPGQVFNYSTGESNLVGEILRAAIGNNAATYLTHKIWQPFGMEHDAYWALAEAGGGELGGCCISATLRDYARIGLFALHDGKLADGSAVLPEGWMADSIAPSPAEPGYGYLWWLTEDGSYMARGLFGQFIYVVPQSNLVIAIHGNSPMGNGTAYHSHAEEVMPAIRRAL